jgi:hypothetical protein
MNKYNHDAGLKTTRHQHSKQISFNAISFAWIENGPLHLKVGNPAGSMTQFLAAE